MLTPIKEKEAKPRNIKEEIYLNFNHRAQRIIIYNLMILLWSLSNILFYVDVVSESGSQHTMYHDSTNNLLLTYHLMICCASFILLFVFYYQLKISDINMINVSFSIAGNRVELPLIDGINLFVGFLYFLSFLFHFGITWKMCGDVCGTLSASAGFGCVLTIISSTLLSIVFPLLWSVDIVDNYLRNPNKRIL